MRKALWVLGVVVLLTPSVSFAFGDNSTAGDCSPIVTGDGNVVTTNCFKNSGIPAPALKSLELSLKDFVRKRMDYLHSDGDVDRLIADLKEEIKNWQEKYRELESSIQAELVRFPENRLLLEADKALKQGEFERSAELLEQYADEVTEHAAEKYGSSLFSVVQ